MMRSLYIHVPFCRAKCPYCDFYSLPSDDALQAQYVARCEELLAGQPGGWQTVYVGGGTPSALKPELLGRLLGAVKPAEGAEFTVECNPGSVTPEFCEVIAQGGVNRVSMGLQSAVEQERRALGRAGDLRAVEQAIALLGAQNLSLDVMLGIPHQSCESLAQTLEFCQAAGAQHISAYLLKVEEGTRFFAQPPEGLPDEDAQAALYLFACEWLEGHGYGQYEIANFARPGYESRHNLNYWRCGEYFALGPGAHGFTAGRRWYYARDLAAFLRGAPPIDDGPGGDDDERAMLALRLREGLPQPTEEMRRRGANLLGYVTLDEQGLRLTREGFLLSNAVIGKLLA